MKDIMSNKLIKLMKKNYDYILIYLLYFIPHLFMKFTCWDDIAYRTYFEEYNYNVFSFLARQYKYWTSRIFIEAAVIIFGWLPPIVWMIVDTLMIVLIYYSVTSLVKLVLREKQSDNKYRICQMLFFLSFPYALMATAGWLTTTINWTWMLALFLYSMKVLLYSIYEEQSSRSVLKNILYCIAFLYATNFDVAVILMLCLIIIIGISAKRGLGKMLSLEYWEGVAITVISLILLIACPGNWVRMEQDAIIHDTADMLTLSVWGKIRMGINSTFYHYMSIPNVVLFTLCVVVLIAIFLKSRNKIIKVISCIPVTIVTAWTCYVFFAYTLSNRMLTYVYPDATFSTCPKTEQYMAMISALILVVTIIFLLRQLIKENELYLFVVVTFLVWGLLPEMVLGFTTTISASILRVVSFFYFALIFICCVLIRYLKMLKHKWIYMGMLFLGGIGTIANFAQMIRHIIVYG